MSETPPFLIQQEPRLSIKEAENIVDGILNKLGIKLPAKDRHNQLVTKTTEQGQQQSMRYADLVAQVRNTGLCSFIQGDLDRRDEVFGGTFGMSTPNWQMKMTLQWAGFKKELQGPCRNVPSEIDISEDIEFYKEEACIESANHDFDMCVRNYRGYLFSSIALVDCYINRHIHLFNFKGLTSPAFNALRESRNTDERIELFVNQFCNFPFAELKQHLIWDKFQKLKTLRNEVVHSVYPYMGIEIKEMAFDLNLSIHGVGSLLKKLQQGQGRFSLGFIERVRTSPAIHFNQVTMRGDGQHKEKKVFSKITR